MGIADIQIPRQKTFGASIVEGFNKAEQLRQDEERLQIAKDDLEIRKKESTAKITATEADTLSRNKKSYLELRNFWDERIMKSPISQQQFLKEAANKDAASQFTDFDPLYSSEDITSSATSANDIERANNTLNSYLTGEHQSTTQLRGALDIYTNLTGMGPSVHGKIKSITDALNRAEESEVAQVSLGTLKSVMTDIDPEHKVLEQITQMQGRRVTPSQVSAMASAVEVLVKNKIEQAKLTNTQRKNLSDMLAKLSENMADTDLESSKKFAAMAISVYDVKTPQKTIPELLGSFSKEQADTFSKIGEKEGINKSSSEKDIRNLLERVLKGEKYEEEEEEEDKDKGLDIYKGTVLEGWGGEGNPIWPGLIKSIRDSDIWKSKHGTTPVPGRMR
jgi:hypothetical protein